MKTRYVVTKGDLGYRIYDRRRKDYLKDKFGYVRWFGIRKYAQSIIKSLPR